MENNKVKEYIYKLIPDFSIIDYAEYSFWSSHKEFEDVDGIWYKIFRTNNSKEITTDSFRALIVSDNELNFSNNGEDFICYELEKYNDRYVYVCFSSDQNPLPIKFNQNINTDFYNYIILIRF